MIGDDDKLDQEDGWSLFELYEVDGYEIFSEILSELSPPVSEEYISKSNLAIFNSLLNKVDWDSSRLDISLKENTDGYLLTDKGMLFSDSVFSAFLNQS